MYTIENNLLHLNPGDQPNRDFCHHNRDSKSRLRWRIFYNSLYQKYDEIHQNHYQLCSDPQFVIYCDKDEEYIMMKYSF